MLPAERPPDGDAEVLTGDPVRLQPIELQLQPTELHALVGDHRAGEDSYGLDALERYLA